VKALPFLALLAVVGIVAGCGSTATPGAGVGASPGVKKADSPEAHWRDVPGGQVIDVAVRFRTTVLSCFVYDGSYAGNLECRKDKPAAGVKLVTVGTDGSWVDFDEGRVRAIFLTRSGHKRTCLEYDGSYKGSINCPDEIQG
jgi:hypothetical protein